MQVGMQTSPLSTPDHAFAMARLALEKILRSETGVTAATEAQVQSALHLLRAGTGNAGAIAILETASAMLQTMIVAQREGRPNLYASKLLRLRRLLLA